MKNCEGDKIKIVIGMTAGRRSSWKLQWWNIWPEYVHDVQGFTGVSEIELQIVELARDIGFEVNQIGKVEPLELHDELTENVKELDQWRERGQEE
jgi:hypothetical protein